MSNSVAAAPTMAPSCTRGARAMRPVMGETTFCGVIRRGAHVAAESERCIREVGLDAACTVNSKAARSGSVSLIEPSAWTRFGVTAFVAAASRVASLSPRHPATPAVITSSAAETFRQIMEGR